ncbi:hypothetical protein KO481_16400 [Nocardia sp. NEAU-G5]|uniref:Uncharacterized protein n=1 Tax=Nocardia albiluteola TaxID=2842303 RepID=A0ABS6AYI8_9NOCA|nr:hypothetical protein [Nocardia albiluteola]MBU3063102.1 hypothetical protein [Nocardia albiluteola]
MTQQSRAAWLQQYGLTLPQHRPEIDVDDPLDIEQRRAPANVRVHLELMIRAAAVASLSESEFIARIRSTSTEIWAASGATPITRYALAHDGRLYRDIDLGRDLALTVLRGAWDTSYAAQAHAAMMWQAQHVRGAHDRGDIRLSHPVMWARMITAAGQIGATLRPVPPAATGVWAHAAARTAGVLAQWSHRAQPAMTERIAGAALDLGRSAQTAPPETTRREIGACTARVAYGLAQLDRAVIDPPREQLLLLAQLMGVVLLIAKAHRDRGEIHPGRGLEAAAASLSMVCRDLHTQAQRRGSAQ